MDGGGIYASGWATVRDSHIARNSAPLGGGIFGNSRNGDVSDCVIEKNSADAGAGINDDAPHNGGILRNVIRHNVAKGGSGGGIRVQLLAIESSVMINNLVVGNQAKTGGGIYVNNYDDKGYTSALLVNNRVADNASREVGQLYFDRWSTWHRLYNNIFAGQPALTCSVAAYGTPTFDHNDVLGGAEGSCATTATTGSNLAVDPRFALGPKGQSPGRGFAAGRRGLERRRVPQVARPRRPAPHHRRRARQDRRHGGLRVQAGPLACRAWHRFEGWGQVFRPDPVFWRCDRKMRGQV